MGERFDDAFELPPPPGHLMGNQAANVTAGQQPLQRPRSVRSVAPLTAQERDTIEQGMSRIRTGLDAACTTPPYRVDASENSVANLQRMVAEMCDQEAEIDAILNRRGYPASSPLHVEQAPQGASPEMQEMYLTRGITALDSHLQDIEERMVYGDAGSIVPVAPADWQPDHALQPYEPPVEEHAETVLSEVGQYMQQYTGMTKDEARLSEEEYEDFVPKIKINWLGVFLAIMFVVACVGYTYVRIRYTLQPLGDQIAYGAVVLIVEILGMVAVFLYVITLVATVPMEVDEEGHQLKRDYHIRVLIPCYKESLAIIKQTILAARHATTPEGCKKTIYLCDDGKDQRKREWILSLDDPHLVYVTGRKRAKNETNGKSNNLNNCLKLIYPKHLDIGYGEVVCLFDADQVCSRSFFTKMLPLIDSGDNVAIALSPQCVYNVKSGQDIFNRSNVQFWEIMLPGYDALGFISCTGTNMLLRSRALKQCNWFPNTTVTEDWELGMWLKKYDWLCRYRQEYLAVGEAPLEVRNAFQQRSRWCKGHFQTFFSSACPLFDKRLGVGMRLLYSGTVVTYLTAALSVPLFTMVPIIAILWGVFPVALNLEAVIAITSFYCVNTFVMFHASNLRRLMALYFVQVSNSILWWTFLKAAVLTPLKIMAGKGFSFKATAKGANKGFNFPIRDLIMPLFLSAFSLAAVIMGLIHIDAQTSAPIALSICWAFWNSLPGLLLLSYTFLGQGRTMRTICLVAFALSTIASTAAILLLWWLYPRDYDEAELMRKTLQFLDVQRSGEVGETGPVDWRLDTFTTLEADINFTLYDLSGGYFSGGLGGNSKLVSNIAFSTTMLSWAILSHRETFEKAGVLDKAIKHANQGAMYIYKSAIYNSTDPGETIFFPHVGNLTDEYRAWQRPEDKNVEYLRLANVQGFAGAAQSIYPIPWFTAQEANQSNFWNNTGAGVGDLAAQMSAALSSAAMAVGLSEELSTNGDTYIARAGQLFELSLRFGGLYTQLPKLFYDYRNSFEGSTSFVDDQVLAGAWLWKALKQSRQSTTGQLADFLEVINTLYGKAYDEWNDEGTYVTRDRILPAATVMLAIEADVGIYHSEAKDFFNNMVCATEPVELTKLDRIWHTRAPTLGDNALAAFLMSEYANRGLGLGKNRKKAYMCKAMSQLRYMVGDRGQGYIVGFGRNRPKRPQHVGATCAAFPDPCPSTSLFEGQANANTLNGALVQGPLQKKEDYNDGRTTDGARVGLQNNAALPGLAAAVEDADYYWMECLQDGGILSKNPVC